MRIAPLCLSLALLSAPAVLQADQTGTSDSPSWAHKAATAIHHDAVRGKNAGAAVAHDIKRGTVDAYHKLSSDAKTRFPEAKHDLTPRPEEKSRLREDYDRAGDSLRGSAKRVWTATRDTFVSLGHHLKRMFSDLTGNH